MNFKLRPHVDFVTKVKGWLASPIQFEDRLGTQKWSDYFGKYQNQKWGSWDTDSCWFLSVINALEDQLEWLHTNNQFTLEAVQFFTDNGFIDTDGDFSLSERFGEIKAGQFQNGGTAPLAWRTLFKYGCIPRSVLSFTDIDSYFDPKAITPEMDALALQFKKYVNIAYQNIPTDIKSMQNALKQAPLTIAIPIPFLVYNWNNDFVTWDGGKTLAHEVELYDIDDKGQYLIFDQYEPHMKILSSDYYIGRVTQGIAYAIPQASSNPIPQNSLFNQIMTAINNFINKATSVVKFN